MIALRQAALDDAAEINDLLLRIAPEIPLQADTLEREEALYLVVRACARSGESWVACDADGRIVGFALAELAQQARHYAEHEIVELHYAGVSPDHRRQGIFLRLMEKIFARLLPVTTTVPALNRSEMVARLARVGFGETGSAGGGVRLRWDPGTAR